MVFMLLFGSGKISGLMTDLAKGIKSFKMGLVDDEDVKTESDPKFIESQLSAPPKNRKSRSSSKPRSFAFRGIG
jgi:sec-independent protein translocase protein TatA